MAPGAKPWSSPVLPAATTCLLLLAVILMAKPATTIAAVDPALATGNPVTCSASHLPSSCATVLNKCRSISRLTGGAVDCAGGVLGGANFAETCCNDLRKMKVDDDHECAKCALLKEFDAIDLTKTCTNGVNTAVADCKQKCEANPNHADCHFP